MYYTAGIAIQKMCTLFKGFSELSLVVKVAKGVCVVLVWGKKL